MCCAMNNKAKLAYFFMIFGLILFLSSSIILLSNKLNQGSSSLSAASSTNYKSRLAAINFTHLALVDTYLKENFQYDKTQKIQFVSRQNKTVTLFHQQNWPAIDTDIYLAWSCHLVDAVAMLVAYKNATRLKLENQNNDATLLKNAFKHILCNWSSFYVCFMLSTAFVGCIFIAFGCVSFYKHEVKSSMMTTTTTTTENNVEESNKENNENMMLKKKNDVILNLTRRLSDPIGRLYTKNNNKPPTKPDDNPDNDSDDAGFSKDRNNCPPFIYDELPSFIVNETTKNNLLFSASSNVNNNQQEVVAVRPLTLTTPVLKASPILKLKSSTVQQHRRLVVMVSPSTPHRHYFDARCMTNSLQQNNNKKKSSSSRKLSKMSLIDKNDYCVTMAKLNGSKLANSSITNNTSSTKHLNNNYNNRIEKESFDNYKSLDKLAYMTYPPPIIMETNHHNATSRSSMSLHHHHHHRHQQPPLLPPPLPPQQPFLGKKLRRRYHHHDHDHDEITTKDDYNNHNGTMI